MSVRLASDIILRFASPWLLSLLIVVPLLAALPILAGRWLRPQRCSGHGCRQAVTQVRAPKSPKWLNKRR